MHSEQLKEFYKTSTFYLDGLLRKEADHFASYIRLIKLYARPGSHVLDLGAGAGLSSHLLAEEFATVGVDLSWLFIKEGAKDRHQNLCYVVGDAEGLSFRAATFDVVGAFELLEHVSDVTLC